ncbi:MAG: hypothetical protein Q9M44_03620 [Ghiorsea sp.]|nr:hypothetical protein [Ghiorsea sp.]
MNKVMLVFIVLAGLSGCGALHDGSGWEHNMDDQSESILEHKH